jgi:hypothetical protein
VPYGNCEDFNAAFDVRFVRIAVDQAVIFQSLVSPIVANGSRDMLHIRDLKSSLSQCAVAPGRESVVGQ